MALFDKLLRPEVAIGVAVGVTAVALAPIVLPAVASAARPLARTAIKTGIILYEQGRETMAELNEIFEDLVAEARAELEQEATFQDTAAEGGSAAKPTDENASKKTNRTPSPA